MTSEIVTTLRGIVGDAGVLDAAELGKRSAGMWRFDTLRGAALVRPTSTAQVSEVMRWCHANNLAVVTHGGLTGLVHGGDAQPNDVILSLERMRAIEAIDPVQRTATVQAGVVLQTLQEEVDKHDLAFPLDLGARGTATIGGNAVDQRRRQPGDPLRHDPRHGPRRRGGAGRRHHRVVAEPADQEQRRLRSQAAVHRLGGHARASSRDWCCGCVKNRWRPIWRSPASTVLRR